MFVIATFLNEPFIEIFHTICLNQDNLICYWHRDLIVTDQGVGKDCFLLHNILKCSSNMDKYNNLMFNFHKWKYVWNDKYHYYLVTLLDSCLTTKKWAPAVTYQCPDVCPQRGHDFTGNMHDPYIPTQYVACWKGVTVGCIACPPGLEFNQKRNACLYHGQYFTEPEEEEYV